MADIDDLIAELKQKRDELNLQMHLASKELQDEWTELEAKMEKFAEKAGLDETSEGVSAALGQLGQELKSGYERIWDAIKKS